MRCPAVLLALAALSFEAALSFAQPNEKLHELFKQYSEDRFREAPELATLRGRSEYDDRWTDWSRAAVGRRAKSRQDYLDRLRPYLSGQLSEQDRLSARLLQYLLERETATDALDVYLLRVGQLFGAHNVVFRAIDAMPH